MFIRRTTRSGGGPGDGAATAPPPPSLFRSPSDLLRKAKSGGGSGSLAFMLLGVAAMIFAGSFIGLGGGSVFKKKHLVDVSLVDDSPAEGVAFLNGALDGAVVVVAVTPSPRPVRWIRTSGDSDDDFTELPTAEDDDDGVAAMQKRLDNIRPPPPAGHRPASAGAALSAPKRLAAKSAECARRMTGLALMDVNRVLLPLPADDGAGAGPEDSTAVAPPAPGLGGSQALRDFVVPQVHTQPQSGEIDGVTFYRPLTLLLSHEHLVIGDLFLVNAECLVFVTVKNRAQPDWLMLRRLLVEVNLGNETIITPFTSVASSLADSREPVGVGKYCNKAFATGGRSVQLAILYRGQRWPVEVFRSPARSSANVAMSTLIGHNWRLLPAWLQYWKKLGVGHFYLYFNDYMHQLAAEPDGPALMSTLAAAADYVTVFEWPFKFDVRVKVEGGDTRVRLQHIAQPLRSHSSFYRFRSMHKYMAFFDVDEYLVPAAGYNTVMELIRGQNNKDKVSPIYSFSNRWAASPVGDFRGLLRLEDIARAGVYADKEVVAVGRTKNIIATRSKVVFVHIHKATTSTEYVKSATRHVPPSSASFYHFTNLETCHGSVAVDIVERQAALTEDASRRDARMAAVLAHALPKLGKKDKDRGTGGGWGAMHNAAVPKVPVSAAAHAPAPAAASSSTTAETDGARSGPNTGGDTKPVVELKGDALAQQPAPSAVAAPTHASGGGGAFCFSIFGCSSGSPDSAASPSDPEEEKPGPPEEGEDPSATALDDAAREQEAHEAALKATKAAAGKARAQAAAAAAAVAADRKRKDADGGDVDPPQQQQRGDEAGDAEEREGEGGVSPGLLEAMRRADGASTSTAMKRGRGQSEEDGPDEQTEASAMPAARIRRRPQQRAEEEEEEGEPDSPAESASADTAPAAAAAASGEEGEEGVTEMASHSATAAAAAEPSLGRRRISEAAGEEDTEDGGPAAEGGYRNNGGGGGAEYSADASGPQSNGAGLDESAAAVEGEGEGESVDAEADAPLGSKPLTRSDASGEAANNEDGGGRQRPRSGTFRVGGGGVRRRRHRSAEDAVE